MPLTINLPSPPTSTPSLSRFATALALADACGQRPQFWRDLLANTPDPASANAAAALAVRLFIDARLAQLGPDSALDTIAQVLAPSAGWSTLGIASVTDATIGQSLSAQLKDDVAAALDAFAVAWLGAFASTVSGVATA